MTPDQALLLTLTGILGVYCELVWPGRVVPGVAGALMAAVGVRGFTHMELSCWGLVFTGLGLAFFLIEAFWRVNLLAGAAGAVSLSVGACVLVDGPGGVSRAVALPACLIFSGLTLFLCWVAKRARRNKWSDLTDEENGTSCAQEP
jgi:membrane-bound ClpP family serine protease